jgi:hypothetical protein
VNLGLEAEARALAGIKGYPTNITSPTPEFVIGSYAALWRIEKSSCAPGRSTTTNAGPSTRT